MFHYAIFLRNIKFLVISIYIKTNLKICSAPQRFTIFTLHDQSTHLFGICHGTFSWDLELHRSQQQDNRTAANVIIGSLANVGQRLSTNERLRFGKKMGGKKRREKSSLQ